ncbi:ATP-binding protein [Pleionea mediterranea]|uniref:Putative HTH transcriptional regulator n=1 Tax=Pleionea mediterranea TaxID=523701 RepID=A0A316FFK2_9GAMM|nr:ATP-binding protein [Pleionea mediterranea]PWK46855.1 putative HTH transcriptional regulator [Pleionea mediterranea]
MTIERDIVLVDELCSQSAENALVEFKHNNFKPEMVGKLCSAMSNAARIAQKDFAYVLWGVDDETQQVIGTTFEPNKQTVGNQVFEFWLSSRLNPSIAFEFRVVEHPKGKVVLLEIPAATSAPVSYDNIPYVRIGSATPKLLDYPDRFQKLIDNIKPFTWEKAIAKSFISADDVLELLDYPKYFKLTQQRLPENKKGILEGLEADLLITKDVGEHWNITNLGAILFANDLQQFDAALARKGVRFIAYDGNNKAAIVTHRQDGRKGYAIGFEGLVEYLNNLLPQNEHIGAVFREQQKLYPEIAIRELIANALIHQDMTVRGAGPQVELFSDRLEITNPGTPLVHTDRMIDQPPRSRNDVLASLMRRMGLCEEQGSGLDKVIISAELFQLPAPKFQAEENSMQATLYAPRSFANMSIDERIRACYQHAVIKYLSGERMKNASLCERFGIDPQKSPAQATKVINAALDANLIKPAEQDRPRAGYAPWWT